MWKWLGPLITRKSVVTSIDYFVHLQVTILRKLLGALITRKRFLTNMCSFVHLQTTSYWNWLTTDHKEKVSHQYAFFCASSNDHLLEITSCIDHKEKVSHQYGFFCATLNYHLEKITLCIDHKEKVQNNFNFFIKCPITNFF